MSVYIYKESSLEGAGEIRVFSPFRYKTPPANSRLWQVNTFADGVGALANGEWSWLGVHASELIEIDPTGAGSAYTSVLDRTDWSWKSGVTPQNVTSGSNDGQSTADSSLFQSTALTAGLIDDWAEVAITANAGDSIDIAWPILFESVINSMTITITKDGQPVPLNGRGFDSGALMSLLDSQNTSKSCVKPWDSAGKITPYWWRSTNNARLEVLRNVAAGTYTIRITQSGTEATHAQRRGVYAGRVIARRPSAGWLTPESGDIVPRFEEYEPYLSTNLRFQRDLSIADNSSLPAATRISSGLWFGGISHGKISSTGETIRVDTGAGFATVTLASLSTGFNGPYERVEFSWTETSDAHNVTTLYVYTMDDNGARVKITQTYGAVLEISSAYMAMLLQSNPLAYIPTEGDDATTPYQPTHYEYRTTDAAGTKIDLPSLAVDDTGHDAGEFVVLHYDDATDAQRILVQRLIAVVGGNFATNSEKQWVIASSKKFYTTVADSSFTTVISDVFDAEFDIYLAEAAFLDSGGNGSAGNNVNTFNGFSGSRGINLDSF